MELQNILVGVTKILKTEFPVLARLDIEPTTSLLSSGLLDSFAIVTLVAELESEFEFELDVENLDLSDFENAELISKICQVALQ